MEASESTFRPYQCKKCRKRVHSILALQQHTRIHRSSRPYQCSICSRSFRLLEHLKWHQQIHKEKPFICNWCESSFAEPFHLGLHLFRHHRVISNGLALWYNFQGSDTPNYVAMKGIDSTRDNNNTIPTFFDKADEKETAISNPENMDAAQMIIPMECSALANEENNNPIFPSFSNSNPDDSLPNELSLNGIKCEVHEENRDLVSSALSKSEIDINLNVEISTSVKKITEEHRLEVVNEQESKGTLYENQEKIQDVVFDPDTEKVAQSLPEATLGGELMNYEDCFTDGPLTDSSKLLLRGDPPLHRSQSGEDLLVFGDSIIFTEEKDSEKNNKKLEAGLHHSNSWSSNQLSSLILSTPQKLSVDPGANSVNASPAMSPFRATINQDESDDEEQRFLEEKKITSKDKLNCAKEIKNVNVKEDKIYYAVKVMLQRIDKENAFKSIRLGSRVKVPLQLNNKSTSKFDYNDIKPRNQIIKNENDNQSTKRANQSNFEQQKQSKEQPKNQLNNKSNCQQPKKQINKSNDDKKANEIDQTCDKLPPKQLVNNTNGKLTSVQILNKTLDKKPTKLLLIKNNDKRQTIEIIKTTNENQPDELNPKPRPPRSNNHKKQRPERKRSKRTIQSEQDNDYEPPGSDKNHDKELKDKDYSRGSDDAYPGMPNNLSSKRELKYPEEGDGQEYNLRPKRRKKFQSLLHDTCECCTYSEQRLHKSVNVQHYSDNAAKVEFLRKQVTELIGTVFPNLKFPPRFKDDSLAVEYLVNEVTAAASERKPKKQTVVPFGNLDGEVKVVLCRYPLGCLRYFRRKIHRLLTTLLPELGSEATETTGSNVDDLLMQVIETNRKATIEQVQNI